MLTGLRRNVLAVGVVALCAIGMAACGSSDDGGDSASSADATKASTPEVSFESVPSKFEGPTEPAKAPKGLKVATVSCGDIFGGCVTPLKAVRDAAKQLGWSSQHFDGAGDPRKWNQGILNAIAGGADAIVVSAINPDLVQQGLQAAKKAGVPVVGVGVGTSDPNPVIEPGPGKLGYETDVSPDLGAMGTAIARWIIKDSDGKANVLFVNDKEFPSVTAHMEPAKETVKKECPGCTSSEVQITAAMPSSQVGQTVVNFLQSHPDIDYIYPVSDGVVSQYLPAVVGAGFKGKVQSAGVLGVAQNIKWIQEGNLQTSDVAFDNDYEGWAAVDQLIRVLNDQPLADPHGENVPWRLIDKEHMVPAKDWIAPFPYKERYMDLWK